MPDNLHSTYLALGQRERDILHQLVQSRVTASSVTLAADLWRASDIWLSEDIYPFIGWALESLSAHGLVVYKVQSGVYIQGGNRLPDLQYEIRLTNLGWEVMGYPHKTVEVAGMFWDKHQREPKPNDTTDYLNYKRHAEGGPIDTETFAEHRQHFPDHVHPLMYDSTDSTGDPAMTTKTAQEQAEAAERGTKALADPTVLADPNGDGTRGYIRVTPEIEARILATKTALGPTSTIKEVAEEVNFPERTVGYVINELPRLRRAKSGSEEKLTGSLKDRIRWLIEDFDQMSNEMKRGEKVFDDANEIRRVLGRVDDLHNIVHELHVLRQQGVIDFDERQRDYPTNIRMQKHAPKKPSATVEAPVEATLEEATPSSLPESAPEPVEEGYPLLDALIARQESVVVDNAKWMGYMQAAEALDAIDPDAASLMRAKANEIEVVSLSPLETEYLRYAEAHTHEDFMVR